MKYAITAAALALALLPASPVLAQEVQVATPTVFPNASVPQPNVPLPSDLSRILGPGSFLQLCNDPLDPRLITGECSAASIAE